jgi:predicted GTPase
MPAAPIGEGTDLEGRRECDCPAAEPSPQADGFESIADFAGRVGNCAKSLVATDPELGNQLKTAADRLLAQTVTVTFGGRFKSGKSTLVNRLLQREILPVNVEAETGAPCFVHSAGEDRAIACRGGEHVEIPCHTEAIREQLSLWRRSTGDSRVPLASYVYLELAGIPVPCHTLWVDTPGMDDSIEMDRASLDVFRSSDLLIWVLNSDAPLAHREVEYVREHTQAAGPQGVAFVTNVFIRDPRTSAQTWQQFLEHQLPVLRNRIEEFAEDMGFDGSAPRMLPVCAAAVGREAPVRYGVAAVQDFIQSITSRDHALVRASRLQRTARALNSAVQVLGERCRQMSETSTSIEAARADWDRSAGARRSAFENRVAMAAESLVGDFRTSAGVAGRTVADSVSASVLMRDDTYAAHLRKELSAAIERGTAVFVEAVEQAARDTDQACADGELLELVRKEIPETHVNVTIPDTPPGSLKAIAAGAAVGILAGLFSFGTGAVAGIAAAKAMEEKGQAKAVVADKEGARKSILEEAHRVSGDSFAWGRKVERLVLDLYQPAGTPPPLPDREAERCLELLAQDVQGLAQEAHNLLDAPV